MTELIHRMNANKLLEKNGEYQVFSSPIADVQITIVKDENDCYTVAMLTPSTGEWRLLHGFHLADAWNTAYALGDIADRLHSVLKYGEQPVTECVECANDATWCLPCATRVVQRLDRATFTEERPSVPCERQ